MLLPSSDNGMATGAAGRAISAASSAGVHTNVSSGTTSTWVNGVTELASHRSAPSAFQLALCIPPSGTPGSSCRSSLPSQLTAGRLHSLSLVIRRMGAIHTMTLALGVVGFCRGCRGFWGVGLWGGTLTSRSWCSWSS